MKIKSKLLLILCFFIAASYFTLAGKKSLSLKEKFKGLSSNGQLSLSVKEEVAADLDMEHCSPIQQLKGDSHNKLLDVTHVEKAPLFTQIDADSLVENVSAAKQDAGKPIEKKEEIIEEQQNTKEKKPESEKKAAIIKEKEAPKLKTVATEEPKETGKQVATKEVSKQAKKEEEKVVFNFENVDLKNVATYIEKIFNVTFITDETLDPIPGEGKGLSGNKITFKTQKPLSKKQAWNLFTVFLNMAGLSVIPQADPDIYRIKKLDQALKAPVPTYIGVDSETLPDNDSIIRYVYFVKECPLDTIQGVLNSLKSVSSSLIILKDHNAFILTDNAYNIKVLMKIVKELDKVYMPQTMSVLKLHKVDAAHVKKIYDNLTKKDRDGTVAARLFGPRKAPTALYFPENAKIIVEPRTNSLVLLGPADAIRRIEDFIAKYIDVDVTAPYSPLHIYDLRYANAADIANIMNNLVKFGQGQGQEGGGAGLRGALRGGDKYFKNMSFTPELAGNKIIIRGDYDDYIKAREIIEKLDEAPAQVAIEVLIISLDISDQKELGSQLRNKFRPPGSRVNFQTSGLRLGGDPKSVVTNPYCSTGSEGVTCETGSGKGATRLLGDLVRLAVGASAGNTVISLGSDKYGVWGIFGALQSISNAQIISNPFLIATNNTPALVQLGSTRRVVSQTIFASGTSSEGESAFSDYKADLTVNVTPKINSDGMIQMDLDIKIDNFANTEATAKLTREIRTSIVASDKEVLALGGLVRETLADNLSGVPVLSKIPLVGWIFKNKKQEIRKQDLLILISAHVVESSNANEFTKRHYKEYRYTVKQADNAKNKRDPIDKAFFQSDTERDIDKFIFTRGKPKQSNSKAADKSNKSSKKNKKKKKTKKKKSRRKKKRESKRDKRRKKYKKQEVTPGKASSSDTVSAAIVGQLGHTKKEKKKKDSPNGQNEATK